MLGQLKTEAFFDIPGKYLLSTHSKMSNHKVLVAKYIKDTLFANAVFSLFLL
jgi:hypothetical protein